MENKLFTEKFDGLSKEVENLLTTNIEKTYKVSELYRRFDLTPIQLRKIIHYLRTQAVPIISRNTGGYYITNDVMEVEKMNISLRSRAMSVYQAAFGLDRWINENTK